VGCIVARVLHRGAGGFIPHDLRNDGDAAFSGCVIVDRRESTTTGSYRGPQSAPRARAPAATETSQWRRYWKGQIYGESSPADGGSGCECVSSFSRTGCWCCCYHRWWESASARMASEESSPAFTTHSRLQTPGTKPRMITLLIED
jgi:hypothetical protein